MRRLSLIAVLSALLGSFSFMVAIHSRRQPLMEAAASPKTRELIVHGEQATFFTSRRPVCNPVSASFLPANVSSDSFSDDTVLLVVANEDTQKAYPLQWLDSQELVYDRLGRVELLITYCGLTHSPTVCISDAQLTVKDLEDSGLIYESNLVLRDRTTGSLWQQLTGECLTGALAGKQLPLHPYSVATFGAIKSQVPHMPVMSKPTSLQARTENLLPNGVPTRLSPDPVFPISAFEPKLPTKERVFGSTLDDVAVAIPLSTLSAETQTHTVGKVHFRSVPHLGSHILEVLTHDGWKPADARLRFWFAWYLTYPNTLVYTTNSFVETIF